MFQPKRLRMHSIMIALFLWASIPFLGQIGPIEKHSVHNDVSAPLADLIRDRANAGPANPQKELKEAFEVRRVPLPPGLKPADEPDSVQQRTVVPAGSSLAAAQAAPISGLGFDGLGNPFTGFSSISIPPDTNGSAGLTQYVQWVNTSFAIYNKANGALIAGPTAGNTLWKGFGGGCETNNNGDPIVLYDKQANRWVLSQFSVSTTPFLQCVAVSTTSDATGTYNRYAFQYSNFDDFPKMGIWRDAYYQTFNMFASGGGFLGADICAYDRNAMLNGQPATQVCFQQGSSISAVLPADMEGLIPPPAGSPNFLLAFGSNSLNMFKFHVDFTTPSNSTLTGPTAIPVAAFTPLCSAGDCVPQAGTTQVLAGAGGNLMYRLSYRNFGGHESLVVNQSVAAGSGSGVRWYELQNPNGTVTLAQQSTFAPDSNFRWMGSIASDRAGDMAMGYSVSSASINPSIAFTGRLASDPASTMQAETTIINGTGSQTSLSRWGDYSAISVDPIDDCTFWYTNEYLKSNGTFNWNTRIVNFRFPSCAGSALTSWLQGDGPHFVYLDGSQHLRQIFDQNFTTWNTEDLTNTTGAAPAALQSALTSWVQSDGPHFVYEDANQHLNQLFFINGAWHAEDLTNTTGAPLATPGSALTTWLDSNGGPHFVYEDVNQHLRVFFFLNGVWQTQDITSTTGAPLAIPGTALTSWVQGDGPHFVFQDAKQHMNQMFFLFANNTWNVQDLTALTGAPLATPGSGLTAWQDSIGPHFVFQDTNQHMNQMFFALSNVTWNTQDLTALTGASLATPQSGLASWLQSDGPHFVYGDTNQHINQFFFINGTWHAEDLTNTTGAPLSTLGSALTVWQQSDGPHFVYQDVNQHTDQIFFLLNRGIWQTQDVTTASGAPPAE